MSKIKLNVYILTCIALLLGVTMAILNLSPSWSQSAGNPHDFLLYACLSSIALAFTLASTGHPEKLRTITRLWIVGNYRVEHWFRLTAYFFAGVISFSVNSEIAIVETFHLIFTALAIASGYVGLMMYPETKKGHTWAFIGLVFGVGGFLFGFLFNLWSIAWGEVFAAIPLACAMLITWKK